MECTEDEAALWSEIRAIRRVTRVVRLKCLCSLSDLYSPDSVILHKPSSKGPRHRQLYGSDRPYWLCHRPLSIYNRHLSLIFSPFTSISHPSPHEHWIVRIILTVTLIAPMHKKSTDQRGWRGQLKRIKTEGNVWRALTSRPNGSISMGQKKIEPILCVESLIK